MAKGKTPGRGGRQSKRPAKEAAEEPGVQQRVSAFLGGLAAFLKARSKSSTQWKASGGPGARMHGRWRAERVRPACPPALAQVEAVAGALERALPSLPAGPAKDYIEAHLSQCAAELHSQLAGPEAEAAAGPSPAEQPAKKAAKRARTAAQPAAAAPQLDGEARAARLAGGALACSALCVQDSASRSCHGPTRHDPTCVHALLLPVSVRRVGPAVRQHIP